jgi:hypothetical protein
MILAINILTIKPAFDRFLRHRVPVEDASHLPPPVSVQCLPRNAVRAQPHLALWADRRGTAADGLQKGRERCRSIACSACPTRPRGPWAAAADPLCKGSAIQLTPGSRRRRNGPAQDIGCRRADRRRVRRCGTEAVVPTGPTIGSLSGGETRRSIRPSSCSSAGQRCGDAPARPSGEATRSLPSRARTLFGAEPVKLTRRWQK